MRVKKLTALSFMTAAALVLSLLENMLPSFTGIPGVRLGLANVVTLMALCLYTPLDAAIVLALRVVLSAIFSGQMSSFFYSAGGGLLCFFIMWGAVKLLPVAQLWVVSILGAMAHNAGQLAVATLLLGTGAVWGYAPMLCLSAIVTGTFTGLCAQFMIKQIRKINGEGSP
ncbi:MAG: Gx transporter family protein [Christensenellales bacterium]